MCTDLQETAWQESFPPSCHTEYGHKLQGALERGGTWDGGEEVVVSDEAVQLPQTAHLRWQAGELVSRDAQLPQVCQRSNPYILE